MSTGSPVKPAANDADQLLTGFLDECRTAVTDILRDARTETVPALRIQMTLAAAKLMRTSVDIVEALGRGGGETRHRVVVEHAMRAPAPELDGGSPSKNVQTIHGVPLRSGPQD
jgi:hypothetical protein